MQGLLSFSLQLLTIRFFSLDISWLVFLLLPVVIINENSDAGQHEMKGGGTLPGGENGGPRSACFL